MENNNKQLPLMIIMKIKNSFIFNRYEVSKKNAENSFQKHAYAPMTDIG